MISCSHPSLQQSDRSWDLEAIIWAEESPCSAGLLLLHSAPLEHQRFFFFFSRVYWICPSPNTPTDFNYISLHSPQLEYKCRSSGKSYLKGLCQVVGLFVCSSFHLAVQVILFVLCTCRAAEGSRHKTQHPHGPLAFRLDLLLPSPLLTLDHWLYSLNLSCL